MICKCEKNRFVFVSDERPEDGKYVFARRSVDRYALFTQMQFRDFAKTLEKAASAGDKRYKLLMRYIFSSAIEVELENGTFYLPSYYELDGIVKAEALENYIEISCE